MPNYDYHCINCNHQEEVFQNITAAALENCPKCHQSTFKRGPGGGIGLQFKGSGFYITDYNSENSPEKTDSNSGSCGCGKPNGCSKAL